MAAIPLMFEVPIPSSLNFLHSGLTGCPHPLVALHKDDVALAILLVLSDVSSACPPSPRCAQVCRSLKSLVSHGAG